MTVGIDFAARADQLRTRLIDGGLPPALLIADAPSVRWLTGLSSSNAVAVLLPEAVVLVTDSRYAAAARCTESHVDVRIDRQLLRVAVDALTEAGTESFVVDPRVLSVSDLEQLRRLADGTGVVFSQGQIEDLRGHKDAPEVELLTRACEISTAALGELLPEIAVGMTEIAVARRLEQLFGELGAEDRAFPSILAAGPNSAIPHHEPTNRVIAAGDILKIDFGARVGGYHADCTRTFIVGSAPTDRQRAVHEAVSDAAAAARQALRVGVEVAELDAIARAVLSDAGLEQYFTHGLGHGIGLEIHESPLLSKASAGTICDGAVVTIEPGVYLPGEFGVRIEDTCHVTADATTILTNFPRELARIG